MSGSTADTPEYVLVYDRIQNDSTTPRIVFELLLCKVIDYITPRNSSRTNYFGVTVWPRGVHNASKDYITSKRCVRTKSR